MKYIIFWVLITLKPCPYKEPIADEFGRLSATSLSTTTTVYCTMKQYNQKHKSFDNLDSAKSFLIRINKAKERDWRLDSITHNF